MRSIVLASFFGAVIIGAIIIGGRKEPDVLPLRPQQQKRVIPYIGSVQVLNACGVEGAAIKIADYLREHHFDVKEIDNALTWNYPFSIVVSRQNTMEIARRIGRVLKTDKIILMRTADQTYDVSVFVGADYEERTQ